jgi:prolyl 4-hydroxylase
MDELGAPNDLTLHEGCPVTTGTKYIVTKWFRERFWGAT